MGRTTTLRPGAVEFGRRVRARREEVGFSQMTFGLAVGLHPTYISDIELGRRNVSLETMLRLAAALDTDPSVLVEGLRPATG